MKKHTLTLDIDLDDENPLLDDIAILFFQTDTPSYLFADDLNHLYRLTLARIDDITIGDSAWPLYTYHDSIGLLDYYLVERPLSSTKILLIRGENIEAKVNNILHDFNEPLAEASPIHPNLQQRNDILLPYQQTLTSVNLYNPQAPVPTNRKAAKERQELDSLLTTLLDHLDLNHL